MPSEEEFEAMLKGVNFYYGYIDNNRRYLQEEKKFKVVKAIFEKYESIDYIYELYTKYTP